MNSSHCHTCELVARRDEGIAPIWDCIYRASHWDVVHSFNVTLPGWLVLVSRRHITAIDEMTPEEAVELGKLLRVVSVALKETTDCVKTYVMQFAEAADHPHVHFHVVPRMASQPEDKKGPKIFGYMGDGAGTHVDEPTMNSLATAIRPILINMMSQD